MIHLPAFFNNSLTIACQLPGPATVAIKVVDLSGRLVQQSNESMSAGSHEAHLNTSNYPGGLYFVVVTIQGVSSYHKIMAAH